MWITNDIRIEQARVFIKEWFQENYTSQHVQEMCLGYDFLHCFVNSLSEVNDIYLFLKNHPKVFSDYLFNWLITESYKY